MTTTTTLVTEETSFEVFKVIEREGERAEWRKIGSATALSTSHRPTGHGGCRRQARR